MGSQLPASRLAAAAALVLTLAFAAPAGAEVFPVNTLDDDQSDGACDADCTVRDAVEDADGNGEDDTINLIAGEHVLHGPNSLLITTSHGVVTVNGAAGLTSIDGADNDTQSIFEVNDSSFLNLNNMTLKNADIGGNGGALVINGFGTVNVTGVTFTGNQAGDDGGAIANDGGELTVTDSTFTGNEAGSEGGFGPGGALANRNNGTATIAGSRFSGNFSSVGSGGGIWNAFDSTMTIRDSTIDNNWVFRSHEDVTDPPGFEELESGGGIWNEGELTVERSAVTNNGRVPQKGGGAEIGAQFGGGIMNAGTQEVFIPDLSGFDEDGPILTVINSTISGNGAIEGGGVYNGGVEFFGKGASRRPVSTFLNATIVNNEAGDGLGGGVFNDATIGPDRATAIEGFPGEIRFKNSIVALNISAAKGGEFGPNCGGTDPVTEGHNLEDGESCEFTGTGDASNTAPGTGDLGDNGGPTRTHALLAGSAALDTADNGACPGTDQRGVTRPQGPVCDKGAFELEVASTTPGAAPQQVSTPAAPPTTPARPTVRVAGVRRACVSRSMRLRIRIGTEGTLRSVTVSLDGRRIRRTTRESFTLNVNARRLRPGRHTLRIVATDTAGQRRTVTRRFTRCARRAQRRVAPRFTG